MKKSPSEILGEAYSSSESTFSIDKSSTEMEFFGSLDGSSGDSFDVSYIFLELLWSGYYALPPEQRPTNWAISKLNPQGTGVDEFRQTYTINFSLKAYPGTLGKKPDIEN